MPEPMAPGERGGIGGKSRPPLSKELQVSVFRRDRWICRWCKRPVVFAPVMKFLEREIRNAGHGAPLSITMRTGRAPTRRCSMSLAR